MEKNDEQKSLLEIIEEKRTELHNLIAETPIESIDLTLPEILEKSAELDNFIVQYQKEITNT